MTDHNAFILNRYIARSIDLLIAWAFALVLPPAGPLAGLLFILIADGFHNGQSPGKRLAGLRVVKRADGTAGSFQESVLRNIPFAVAYLFFIIPILGWFLFIIVGIPILLFESYLICTSDGGIRTGDILADTRVAKAPLPGSSSS